MRRHRLLNLLATATAMSAGVVMLIGLLSDPGSEARTLAALIVQLVAVTAAVAVLIGILNLLAVHLGRFTHAERGWPYSALILLVTAGVVVLRILDRAEIWSGDLEGEQISPRAFEAVQVSIESALAGLLVFFLVFAGYRLMRRGVSVWNVLFTSAVVVALVGWIPLGDLEALSDVREWLVSVPVSAGARGILLGVALGTVTAGVRVLLGQDRALRG
ncbi:MAG TPA: hypothetical protein PKD46_10035 [Aggregatilineaceae bacterium]|nr:hypothetical protein [Aggregatilineaceae bacterium]